MKISGSKFEKSVALWFPVIVWAGVIFWLSSFPHLRSGLPTFLDIILRKIGHMVEFGVLTWLLTRARAPLLWAGVSALLYAVSDEWHQTFIIGREGTVRDVLIDAVGIAVIVIISRSRRS